jgi:hypothetical protein
MFRVPSKRDRTSVSFAPVCAVRISSTLVRVARFPPGLATNLRRLGAKVEVTQRILRHSNEAVAQKRCIKTLDEDVVEAIRLRERSVENAPSMHLLEPKASQVM